MNDPKIERAVVFGLVMLAVVALAGIILLSQQDKSIPDVLQNIAIGAMTAVAGILAKTNTPSPTRVVLEDEPIQVEPAKPNKKKKRKNEPLD